MYLTENEVLRKTFLVIKEVMDDEDIASWDAVQGVMRLAEALLKKEDS